MNIIFKTTDLNPPHGCVGFDFKDDTDLRIKYKCSDDIIREIIPERIEIETKTEEEYPTYLAHEVAHVLTWILFPKLAKHGKADVELFREEMITWRIARSFCKPKLWNEHQALLSLKAYAHEFKRNVKGKIIYYDKLFPIDWGKVKIIPWDDRRLNE